MVSDKEWIKKGENFHKNVSEEHEQLTHVSCVQYVPVAALGRTVPGAAAAPTMVHATPLMAPVSVIQDGSAVTAHSVRSLNEMINDLHGGSDVFYNFSVL